MKKAFLSLLTLLVAAVAQANNWKIGPSSVAGMDFASINAAMNDNNVSAGDTLYLDQYYNESAEQTVSKAVVIIGTGYDITLNDEQVVARLTNTLQLKVNKVIVKSVCLSSIQFWAKDCIMDRCYVTSVNVAASIDGMNHIYSCYIEGNITGYVSTPSQLDIQNCVINGFISYLSSSIINNNVLFSSEFSDRYSSDAKYLLDFIGNSTITNNISRLKGSYSSNYYDYAPAVYASGSGNSIEHNIVSMVSVPNYPTNKGNSYNQWNAIFTCNGAYSNYYKLVTETGDNPAMGYATDGGDCGCHGGMFGCPSGGRPQYIPYFKKVTVGSRTEDGKLPVTLKIAIQSE